MHTHWTVMALCPASNAGRLCETFRPALALLSQTTAMPCVVIYKNTVPGTVIHRPLSMQPLCSQSMITGLGPLSLTCSYLDSGPSIPPPLLFADQPPAVVFLTKLRPATPLTVSLERETQCSNHMLAGQSFPLKS